MATASVGKFRLNPLETLYQYRTYYTPPSGTIIVFFKSFAKDNLEQITARLMPAVLFMQEVPLPGHAPSLGVPRFVVGPALGSLWETGQIMMDQDDR